jgi:hypothetical protein
MEDNSEKFGNLFGSIDLLSEEHLEIILATMEVSTSIYYLIESVKSAHRKGAFTLGESEVISKAIRVLLKQSDEK